MSQDLLLELNKEAFAVRFHTQPQSASIVYIDNRSDSLDFLTDFYTCEGLAHDLLLHLSDWKFSKSQLFEFAASEYAGTKKEIECEVSKILQEFEKMGLVKEVRR